MATKTITIDIEAYERLKEARQPGESFSRTIKRVVRKRIDLEAMMARVRKHSMSKEAIAAVEEQIAGRRQRSRRRG